MRITPHTVFAEIVQAEKCTLAGKFENGQKVFGEKQDLGLFIQKGFVRQIDVNPSLPEFDTSDYTHFSLSSNTEVATPPPKIDLKRSETATKQNPLDFLFEKVAEQAKRIVYAKGILYDTDGVMWAYEDGTYTYNEIDETNLFRIVSNECGLLDGLQPQYRTAYMNAIKLYARERADQVIDPLSEKYKYCVQFREFLFDLKSKEQRMATKDDFVHNSVMWEPKLGKTPIMDKLFNAWTNGKATTLKDIIAYSCIPHNTMKYIFFYYGNTGTGKSQFINVLQKFLGKKNCCTSDFAILSDPTQRFEKVALRNKLAVFISEIDGKKVYHTSALKTLSGNDFIRGEYKNKGLVSFRFGGKAHIATNSIPTVMDEEDDAYVSRTVIVEFPNRFTSSSVEIIDTIPEEEFCCLAGYCLLRLQQWAEKGITLEGIESAEVRAKIYRERTDIMRAFIKANIDLDHEKDFAPDTNYRVSAYEFRSAFNGWIQKRGHGEWTPERIGREMTRVVGKDCFEKHKRENKDKTTFWEYRGLRFKDPQKTLQETYSPARQTAPQNNTYLSTSISTEVGFSDKNSEQKVVDIALRLPSSTEFPTSLPPKPYIAYKSKTVGNMESLGSNDEESTRNSELIDYKTTGKNELKNLDTAIVISEPIYLTTNQHQLIPQKSIVVPEHRELSIYIEKYLSETMLPKLDDFDESVFPDSRLKVLRRFYATSKGLVVVDASCCHFIADALTAKIGEVVVNSLLRDGILMHIRSGFYSCDKLILLLD